MQQNRIVSQDEWLAARRQHLIKEKEFTRLRDQLSAERRALPWVKVEKNYIFDGPNGKETLADLFDGRSHQTFHVRPRMGGGLRGLLLRGRPC